MPPPLPCWRRTTPMRTRQTKTWTMSMKVWSMSLRVDLGAPSGLGDSTERARVQARTTDEGPVDVRAREERRGIVRLDRAAVEDARPRGERLVLVLEPGADGLVDLFCLRRARD